MSLPASDREAGSGQRILVVAAHADDEVLGAGGTLAAAVRSGAAARVVILSVASTSRDTDEATRRGLTERRVTAARSAAELGGWSLELHEYPDNAFDTVRQLDLVKIIEQEILSFTPSIVLTHFHGDLSRDHQITAAVTATAARPTGTKLPPALAYFEIRSSTEWAGTLAGDGFRPSLWVPLEAESWRSKLRALEFYADELRPPFHPRSLPGVEALARYRGTEIGVEFAEAFVLGRGIVELRR